jgi:uncharacterized membrane protein
MWFIGLIVGVMLGAAFESFTSAMLLGAVGTVVGAIIGQRRSGNGDEQGRQIKLLQEQLKQMGIRVAYIEKYLEQATAEHGSQGLWADASATLARAEPFGTDDAVDIPDALAATIAVAHEADTSIPAIPAIPVTAPSPAGGDALPDLAPIAVDDAELTRQAQAGAEESATLPAALPPLTDDALAAALACEFTADRRNETVAAATDDAIDKAADAAPTPLVDDLAATTAAATFRGTGEAEFPAAKPATVAPARPSAPHQAPRLTTNTLAAPTWPQGFIARWVTGSNPIVKIGVLVLFLGFAFLLRYVAENTTVPIELRYAGVAAAGIGMLLFGWRWRHKQDRYGLILQGGGIGVLYLTTLAGMKLHPLIPPEFGFVILLTVAVFAALLAILEDARALAVAASLGGFAAPVLAATGSEHHLAFFSYLAIINLGILAIAWFKTWRILNLIGFTSTLALAGIWAQRYYEPSLFGIAEPFLLLFFFVYVLIAFLFARRTLADTNPGAAASFAEHVRQAAPRVAYVDASLVFGVPITTFGLQYLLSLDFAYGPAYSALAFGLTYIVLGYLLFRRHGLRYALLSETMLALAIVFGSLAIPFALESEWTSAAWAVEAAGVYWVGIRQERLHARLFAFLLMAGAAVYFALDLAPGDTSRLLAGSPLGSLMLALALAWTCRLQRRAPAPLLHELETASHVWLIAAACLFAALLPPLLWQLEWAAPALALLATAGLLVGLRKNERELARWSGAYQLAAGIFYLYSLHAGSDDGAFARSWAGLTGALLIGVPLLISAIAARPRGTTSETAIPTLLSAPILIAGLAFLALAPLFVLSWQVAATLWPLLAFAILIWALRRGEPGALALAAALQLLTAAVCLDGNSRWFPLVASDAALAPFHHAGFWAPLLLALAALASARCLHRAKEENVRLQAFGWGALWWSALWWAYAWGVELPRVLAPSPAIAALLAVTVLTACAWRALARCLQWQAIGQATLAYLPTLALLALAQHDWAQVRPLAGWSLLAWAAAFLAHLRLLRAQAAWFVIPVRQGAHAAGVWLFVILAALELHAHFAAWAAADSAWPWFGWLLAPLAFVAAANSRRLAARWPASPLGQAYTRIAVWPFAAFLLGWSWYGALLGDGAAPLRFVPLLNPIELGQTTILLGVVHWWTRHRREQPFAAWMTPFAVAVGATAFTALSAAVLRACHHLTGISWHSDALFTSMFAQSALSIVWSVVAIALMLIGNRHARRWVWIAGTALIAVVVVKLFLVELAARGSLERIVSFIVVGLLLLLVGYFAPLPPRRLETAASTASSEESSRA